MADTHFINITKLKKPKRASSFFQFCDIRSLENIPKNSKLLHFTLETKKLGFRSLFWGSK
jgi:hypothetical protein